MESGANNPNEREPLVRTTSEPAANSTKSGGRDQIPTSSTDGLSNWAPKQRPDLPPGTSLASIFRYHMGIDHDEWLVPNHLAQKSAIDPIATGKNQGRRAVNLGIYNRCIREERGTAQSFQIWSVVINGALGCQVIFAAVLTALGAGNGPHDLVAVFGTLNTIIAGFLTYLKGTGLPMRMKYFHNQWLKLRAYIEQRERDFASDDLSQVHRISYAELMEEVDIIEKMYHNIRKDVERHTPDSFGGKNDNSATEAPGEGAPEASLASRGLNAMKNRLANAESGAQNFVEDLESRLMNRGNRNDAPSTSSNRYGKSNGKAADMPRLDDLEEASEDEDVTNVAMERMRVLQARHEEAQEAAERRVKELEAKLAALEKSGEPDK